MKIKMKYTKKQIEAAFKKWEIEERTNPSKFMHGVEVLSFDVEEIARAKTNVLINLMNL